MTENIRRRYSPSSILRPISLVAAADSAAHYKKHPYPTQSLLKSDTKALPVLLPTQS